MTAGHITRLVVVERWRRILGLIGFCILFLISGFTARLLVGGSGHVEAGQLYQIVGAAAAGLAAQPIPDHCHTRVGGRMVQR